MSFPLVPIHSVSAFRRGQGRRFRRLRAKPKSARVNPFLGERVVQALMVQDVYGRNSALTFDNFQCFRNIEKAFPSVLEIFTVVTRAWYMALCSLKEGGWQDVSICICIKNVFPSTEKKRVREIGWWSTAPLPPVRSPDPGLSLAKGKHRNLCPAPGGFGCCCCGLPGAAVQINAWHFSLAPFRLPASTRHPGAAGERGKGRAGQQRGPRLAPRPLPGHITGQGTPARVRREAKALLPRNGSRARPAPPAGLPSVLKCGDIVA